MRLTQLEVFCTIYKHKSVSRASEELIVTQPAVSSQLHQLEQELEVELFERVGRSIRSTAAGDLLYKYALEILKLKNDAKSNMEQFRLGLSGQVVLGMATGTVYCIPDLLHSYRESFPKVKLVLKTDIADVIRKSVIDGKIDFGLIWGPVVDNRLESIELTNHEYIMVVSNNHPLANQSIIDPKELGQFSMIFPPPNTSTRRYLEGTLTSLGVMPNISIELPTTDTMKWAATAGLGVAFLSLPSVKLEIESGLLKVLRLKNNNLMRPITLIRKKKPNITETAGNFLEYIINHPYWK